jgi:hypothetical protein
MTADQFRAWRGRMTQLRGTYSLAAAARDLDLSLPMAKLYEKGSNSARRDATGAPLSVVIPTASPSPVPPWKRA